MQFRTTALRDDMARRLGLLAVDMIQNRVVVTPKLIDDIRTAAYLVGMTEVIDADDSSRADGSKE